MNQPGVWGSAVFVSTAILNGREGTVISNSKYYSSKEQVVQNVQSSGCHRDAGPCVFDCKHRTATALRLSRRLCDSAFFELELIQSHMAQKPVLRGEVGCACVAR